MDTNLPATASREEDQFFRPGQIVPPVRRNLFTVKIRLIHNNSEDASQTGHEPAVIASHAKTHPFFVLHRNFLALTANLLSALPRDRKGGSDRMSSHDFSSPVIASCAAVWRSSISVTSATGLPPAPLLRGRNDRINVASMQRGAVLITGLIFLVVLTLLGTTALQGTILEEKMAGNLRDETLAFQAAEAALRSGERFLEQVTLPEFNGADGLYHYMCSSIADPNAEEGKEEEPLACPPTPDPVAEMNWNADNSKETDVAMEGVASQPRYFIEQLGNISLQGDSGSAQQSGTALDATMFRIVARGVGGTETAAVLLQSTYRR